MNNKEQQKAQARARNDTLKSLQMRNEDILEKIFYCANVPPPYEVETSEKRALAYFSSLLINLSRQAEESTEKIVNLTEKLTKLTKWLAILTIAILLIMLLQIFLPYIRPPQNIKENIQQKAQRSNENSPIQKK